jgi:hypothetical protein
VKNNIWPPAPVRTQERQPYDGYLYNTLYAAGQARSHISRLHLIKALRDIYKLDFREAKLAVDSYCNRNHILQYSRGMVFWLNCIAASLQFIAALSFIAFISHMTLTHNTVHSHVERLIRDRRIIAVDMTFIVLTLIMAAISVTCHILDKKRTLREITWFMQNSAPTDEDDTNVTENSFKET